MRDIPRLFGGLILSLTLAIPAFGLDDLALQGSAMVRAHHSWCFRVREGRRGDVAAVKLGNPARCLNDGEGV